MADRSRHERAGGGPLDGVVGQGTLLAGRYRLVQPLPGDLDEAAEWEAFDQFLDRTVRARVLRGPYTAAALDAARRAALVADPRLVRILDVGEQTVPYVVTEPWEGSGLDELTANGPLPADQARAIIGEAAEAVEAARRRGVHHLALQPSRLRRTKDARILVTGLAVDAALQGIPDADAHGTSRADAVALVALLYHALTGRWPGREIPTVPPAPVVRGVAVPPAELSPGIPNDLDTLCAVTLGPNDDGPHSPAELVRELEPWAAVRVSSYLDGGAAPAGARPRTAPATVSAPATAPAVAAAPAAEPAAPAGGDVSAADTSAGDTSAGGGRPSPEVVAEAAAATARVPVPATLPPAIRPARSSGPRAVGGAVGRGAGAAVGGARLVAAGAGSAHAVGSAAAGSGAGLGAAGASGAGLSGAGIGGAGLSSAAATGIPSGQPPSWGTLLSGAPQGAAQPQGSGQGQPREPGHGPGQHGAGLHGTGQHGQPRSSGPTSTLGSAVARRFDPTPWVLALLALLVVVGLVFAVRTLSEPLPQIFPGERDPAVVAPPPAQTPTPPADTTPTPAAAPVIASARSIDPPPDGDENEHPELVHLAIDGDPGTIWYSRTYVSATYGMKTGIGFAVTLQEPATVTTVTVHTRSSGGEVELRATDPATPTDGEVLAGGPVAAETVLTLAEPTVTQHVVLWFPHLPQTADGSNRIEITEITVE